jgi:uncharacterized protein
MFGASKLLLFLLVLGVVWLGFRYVNRVQAVQRSRREQLRRGQAAPRRETVAAEDLVKCRVCGAYVAARSATACGRGECPWGGPR